MAEEAGAAEAEPDVEEPEVMEEAPAPEAPDLPGQPERSPSVPRHDAEAAVQAILEIDWNDLNNLTVSLIHLYAPSQTVSSRTEPPLKPSSPFCMIPSSRRIDRWSWRLASAF